MVGGVIDFLPCKIPRRKFNSFFRGEKICFYVPFLFSKVKIIYVSKRKTCGVEIFQKPEYQFHLWRHLALLDLYSVFEFLISCLIFSSMLSLNSFFLGKVRRGKKKGGKDGMTYLRFLDQQSLISFGTLT